MDTSYDFTTADQQGQIERTPSISEGIVNSPAILQEIIAYRGSKTAPQQKVETKVSGLRSRVVRDTALSQGAQAGLYYRNQQIQAILKADDSLDVRYNFAPFIEQDKVLIPVIVKSEAVEVFDGETIKSARVQYTIGEPARLVMSAPTYRSYLIEHFNPPQPPRDVLKPRTKKEVEIWRAAVIQGWVLGIQQANDSFDNNLARLDRDIDGRLEYLKMRELGMVNDTALKVTKSGITFNGSTMNIGQVVYSISENVNYRQLDEWKAAISEK